MVVILTLCVKVSELVDGTEVSRNLGAPRVRVKKRIACKMMML